VSGKVGHGFGFGHHLAVGRGVVAEDLREQRDDVRGDVGLQSGSLGDAELIGGGGDPLHEEVCSLSGYEDPPCWLASSSSLGKPFLEELRVAKVSHPDVSCLAVRLPALR
jgi:hypothetical protein